MDASHLQRFSEWFDVLAVTHRLNASEDIRGRMKSEYFDVLRSYPIEAVASAYESLRRKMKKWPVPADWLEALPPFGSTGRLTLLTAEEEAENDAAEALGYEAAAYCHCSICERDQATHLKPRYVPRLDRDGQVMERRHPTRMGRPILLGMWLHGRPLKNWYIARARYYELKTKFDVKLVADRRTKGTLDERIAHLERLTTEAKAVLAETKSA